jgi:hypothetical protein
VLEVTELRGSTVDEKALAIHNREGSQGIPFVITQKKFTFPILVLSILTKLTDKTLQTGSKGLAIRQIAPRHRESLPHVRLCFSSYSMNHDTKPGATTVIHCIKNGISVTGSKHLEQYLPEGMYPVSGCIEKAIAVKKKR